MTDNEGKISIIGTSGPAPRLSYPIEDGMGLAMKAVRQGETVVVTPSKDKPFKLGRLSDEAMEALQEHGIEP